MRVVVVMGVGDNDDLVGVMVEMMLIEWWGCGESGDGDDTGDVAVLVVVV